MSDAPVSIRPARVDDVPAMLALVNDFAEQGLMIHRSQAELFEHLRDFVVAERAGELVGVTGLRVMWSTLSEVYALAVSPGAQGVGVGRRLVDAAVADAQSLGVHRLFALTYERGFFERCGFAVVDRQQLPLKVWGECIRCPKHDACDEIAMVRVLHEPTPAELATERRLADEYDVPDLPSPIDAVLRIDRTAGDNER